MSRTPLDLRDALTLRVAEIIAHHHGKAKSQLFVEDDPFDFGDGAASGVARILQVSELEDALVEGFDKELPEDPAATPPSIGAMIEYFRS